MSHNQAESAGCGAPAGLCRTYREYDMWLQGGGVKPVSPLRIQAGPGVPTIAREELELGLRRLYGEQALCGETVFGSGGAGSEKAPDADGAAGNAAGAFTLTLAVDPSLPAEGFRLAQAGGQAESAPAQAESAPAQAESGPAQAGSGPESAPAQAESGPAQAGSGPESAPAQAGSGRGGAIPPEGFRLAQAGGQAENAPAQAEGGLAQAGPGLTITGGAGGGLLYGVFRFLLLLGGGGDIRAIEQQSAPAVARRAVNHWDNMDGHIERGYAGASIFFKGGQLCYDAGRIRDYARFLASVGINVVSINNVNVTPQAAKLIGGEMLPKVAALAAIFRPYNIRLALSVHFDSPVLLGGLSTADPLAPEVIAWWQSQTAEVYRQIPDFSGYVMKADSEFRGGPHAVGRTQAEGANTLARALAPHGGVLYWRCFIYDCQQDWRDTATDRPKAPYEIFKVIDGQFDANVILQIKNGPADFQVREPVSPLLGNMQHTREALELQITQEYTGHQIDLFNLAVLWREVLDAPVDEGLAVKDLFGGGNRIDTAAAVVNVGDDENWTGHTLAQANLYAYGRMMWDPCLCAKAVTDEWIKLSFGAEPRLVSAVSGMMMRSRYTYEKYSCPLALGWMVNPNGHYGPGPEGYEFAKWGTYHRADLHAVGIDRGPAGTGYAAQYRPYVARMYGSVETCPEELLLFFHRLRYDYVLKSGKTLLQYIYDTHFEGAAEVEEFIAAWESLERLLPQEAYRSVRERLARQLLNAREWRDVVNTYFYRKTGIPDAQGRKIYA